MQKLKQERKKVNGITKGKLINIRFDKNNDCLFKKNKEDDSYFNNFVNRNQNVTMAQL